MSDYEKGREAIEALAPLVSQHGGGKEFAVLVDMVDSLKPKEGAQAEVLPHSLQGRKAQLALMLLQVRFRKATGINVFDTMSEELVRAAWGLAKAIVEDQRDEVAESYRNSGADSHDDWDALDTAFDRLEIPQNLGALLWGVNPRKGR